MVVLRKESVVFFLRFRGVWAGAIGILSDRC